MAALRPAHALPALALAFCATSLGAQTIDASVAALTQAKRQAQLADRRAALFEAQAAAAADEAARARAAEAAVAERIQSAEADIAAAQARIALVEQLRARQRARLAARQGPIVRLAAALQTMARRPPALALVQPGSVADIAHVRALLASELPLVQARTASLRAEVEQGARLREQADAAVATLRAGRARLDAERSALARLETQHSVRSQALTDNAMFEQDRAMALGERARDIVDLMGTLDEQAATRERLADLPGPVLRPPIPGATPTPPPQLVRSPPANLPYRIPVVGKLVTGLGEVSAAGVRARGLTLATAPRAQVVAPASGRIAYAGPFSGYGEIVIIDHGRGWTTLLTNLGGLSVRVGDTVDRGSPIGRSAADHPRVTVELRRNGAPVDITRIANG
jgi:murein hydrolase activator